MKLTNASIGTINGKTLLMLEVPHADVKDFLERFEGKYPLDIEIKQKRKKRSTDANGYCWVLCDKIASYIGITKEEVYQSHIRDVGVFTDVWIKLEAMGTFCDNWQSNGIGWLAEPLYLKGDWANVRTYYGSSTYDTKEMSRLIDSLVEEARGYKIEVLPPDELERMMQAWNTQ